MYYAEDSQIAIHGTSHSICYLSRTFSSTFRLHAASVVDLDKRKHTFVCLKPVSQGHKAVEADIKAFVHRYVIKNKKKYNFDDTLVEFCEQQIKEEGKKTLLEKLKRLFLFQYGVEASVQPSA